MGERGASAHLGMTTGFSLFVHHQYPINQLPLSHHGDVDTVSSGHGNKGSPALHHRAGSLHSRHRAEIWDLGAGAHYHS